MRRRKFTARLLTLGTLAAMRLPAEAQGFSETEAAGGVRAALERGAVAAVGLLG